MGDEPFWTLSRSFDAMNDAIGCWMADRSPANRATAQAAIREYADQLSPLIGATAAFKFSAAFEACEAAIDRLAALNATLSAQASIDDADVEMLRQAQQEQTAAVEALEHANKDTEARLAETFQKGGA